MSSPPRRLRRRVLFLFALLALLAGCGGSSPTANPPGAETASEAVEAPAEPTATAEAEDADAEEPAVVAESEPQPTAELISEPEPEPEPTPEPQPTPEPVSYDGSFSSTIQPILEDKCSSCHYDGGPGAFHWNLRTAQDVVDTHLLVQDVVTTSFMPPWPAGDRSVGFVGDRSLTPDQVQAIVDWVEDGAPIDTDPDAPVESADGVVGLANPDMHIEPEAPYAGDLSRRDDLRCLIYDPQLDEGGWLTGYEFLPDQKAVVHHAVGYLMQANHREQVEARGGADGKPGWHCAGGEGLRAGRPIVGWTPGQDATVYSEGSGQWMAPGSFFVVQMHYHYDVEAPLDNSTLALVVDPPDADLEELRVAFFNAPAEIPCASWQSGPLCDREAAYAEAVSRFGATGVPANAINRDCGVTPADFERFTDGLAESSCTISAVHLGFDVEIESVLLHMHELGSWTRLTINKGLPDERIVVDIPNWDFDWQYAYALSEPLAITRADTITLECGWDRSRGRSDLEPAWIVWAEGTTDEMCTTYITYG